MALPKGKPRYRGVLVGASKSALLYMVRELTEDGRWTQYTCHMIERYAEDIKACPKRARNRWMEFLEGIGIPTDGGGFCSPSNVKAVDKAEAPDWLVALAPNTKTYNELRLAFINDVLRKAFKHEPQVS